jgi:hypothetical protein
MVGSTPQAVSFTDDTSLPYASFPVSIHAQVIREQPLSWYFYLKARVPDGKGEFKEDALRTFIALAESERQQILKTLRMVRIHITDPRPYSTHIEDILRRILPKGTTVQAFLRRLDDSTQHLADLRTLTIEFVAERILLDSPAERLKRKYKTWECSNAIRRTAVDDWAYADALVEQEPEPPVDLTPFQHQKAHLFRDVTRFVSASASVFSSALDRFDEAVGDYLFASPMAGPWLVTNALGTCHAFDEGNSRAVKWITEQRASVLKDIDRYNHFYPEVLPEPLQELASTACVPIQAADIAANIARELWRRKDLVHVVRQFDYVTYNGQRISEDQAASYQTIIGSSGSSN